jgi:non-ribosomal peptide synthetase component F
MRELDCHRQMGAKSLEMPVVFTRMIGMDLDDPSQPDWLLMRKQIFEMNQTAQVWIDYRALEYGGALTTRWFVAKNLFEPSFIEALFSLYKKFLELLAADDSQWEHFTPSLRLQHESELYQPLHSQQAIDNESLMPKQALSVIGSLAIQAQGGCYLLINNAYGNECLEYVINELYPFAILTVTATAEKTLASIDLSSINTLLINIRNFDSSAHKKKPLAYEKNWMHHCS